MPPTPLQQVRQLVAEWKDCTRCPLHLTRCQVVHGRGSMPCDVLFVGEAPGDSEDATGVAFDGPAGALLDQIIRDSTAAYQVPGTEGSGYNSVQVAIVNVIGCIPKDGDGRKTDVDYESVEACRPRLEKFIRIADPKLIITVGKTAKEALEQGLSTSTKLPRPVPMVHIEHPAHILRMPFAGRGLATRRCVVTIAKAIEQLKGI